MAPWARDRGDEPEEVVAMAYLQTPSVPRRSLTIGAVAALHAALLYALVTGFAATMFEKIDVYMPSRNYKADPPPPEPQPTMEPSHTAEPRPFIAPRPDLDLGKRETTATVFDVFPQPQPTAQPGPIDPGLALPPPTPSASFVPRAASPLGSPGKWASSEDYPAAALREAREGVARFRVTIGSDGRVRNCEITASSGSADLDRATCATVSKRARFKPATDASGAVVGGSYSSAVKWEIPG